MKKLFSLSTLAAVTLGSLISTGISTGSFAAEPGAAYGGSIGALALETRGLATTPDEVRLQGGFATAGAVHWTAEPVSQTNADGAAF